MKHKCQEGRSCCCSITALEPDDDCPLHGYPWPPRCEICGRFMKWLKFNKKECHYENWEAINIALTANSEKIK
jgi:hypothetical protein